MKKQDTITIEKAVKATASKAYVPHGNNILKKGSKGVNVERLHSYLSKFGYFSDRFNEEFSGSKLKTNLAESPKK